MDYVVFIPGVVFLIWLAIVEVDRIRKYGLIPKSYSLEKQKWIMLLLTVGITVFMIYVANLQDAHSKF